MKCICSEAGCRVDLHRQIKVELKKYAMLGNFVSSPVHALNAGGMKPVGAATCRGSQGRPQGIIGAHELASRCCAVSGLRKVTVRLVGTHVTPAEARFVS